MRRDGFTTIGCRRGSPRSLAVVVSSPPHPIRSALPSVPSRRVVPWDNRTQVSSTSDSFGGFAAGFRPGRVSRHIIAEDQSVLRPARRHLGAGSAPNAKTERR
jgi:hypothetical protein